MANGEGTTPFNLSTFDSQFNLSSIVPIKARLAGSLPPYILNRYQAFAVMHFVWPHQIKSPYLKMVLAVNLFHTQLASLRVSTYPAS